MKRGYFLTGNTIRFEATFLDWNDDMVPIDPAIVKFKVYDNRHKLLEEMEINDSNRSGLGKYFAYYIPEKAGQYSYEWYADIDGLPSLERRLFIVKEV